MILLLITILREIWNSMNLNGNKYLSLVKVDKDIIDIPFLKKTISFLKVTIGIWTGRYFWFKKGGQWSISFHKKYFSGIYACLFSHNCFNQGDSIYGDELLDFKDFRLFLQPLRATLEFYQVIYIHMRLSYTYTMLIPGTHDSIPTTSQSCKKVVRHS